MNGTPLQYSCLENPMDGGAWWAAVHGVAKSRTQWSAFPFTFPFYALEKEMATHSSVLAWRIPGMAEPAGLPSMGSHRVRHDWSNSAAAAAVIIAFQRISLPFIICKLRKLNWKIIITHCACIQCYRHHMCFNLWSSYQFHESLYYYYV